MNNARYIALVGDWLAKTCGGPQEITSILVHFLHETPVWSDVTVSGAISEDGQFQVDIVKNNETPVTVFAAEGTIRQNGETTCSE